LGGDVVIGPEERAGDAMLLPLLVKALKPIQPGEEILVDYGEAYCES
jgi:SET domain-containing protein